MTPQALDHRARQALTGTVAELDARLADISRLPITPDERVQLTKELTHQLRAALLELGDKSRG